MIVNDVVDGWVVKGCCGGVCVHVKLAVYGIADFGIEGNFDTRCP